MNIKSIMNIKGTWMNVKAYLLVVPHPLELQQTTHNVGFHKYKNITKFIFI